MNRATAIQGALFGEGRRLRLPTPADACAHHGISQCEDCYERNAEGAVTADSPAAEWDGYVNAAPNFAVAQERIEEAVIAGVDFGALLNAQRERVTA